MFLNDAIELRNVRHSTFVLITANVIFLLAVAQWLCWFLGNGDL